MAIAEDLRRRLAELVAFDTQNPMGQSRPLAEKLAGDLRAVGAGDVEMLEAGGHHSVFATFGNDAPRLMVNAHLDTVPANAGYTASPLKLVERDGRLHGLGACDTKGAIAAILQALATRKAEGRQPRGVAVLFSGDEERHNASLIGFLASGLARGIERVIVCEPTGGKIGHRHRGIGSAEATTTSPGGHSSRADVVPNPMTALARGAVALDDFRRRHEQLGPEGFKGLCLNVAALDGGVAFNVIPSRATLRMSLRPAPGADVLALLAQAEAEVRKAAAPQEITWQVFHQSPTFATRDLRSFGPLLGDRVETPVDLAFWTEAALFSAAGMDAVVFGPGRIEQAHAPDEFVEPAELEMAHQVFLRVFSR